MITNLTKGRDVLAFVPAELPAARSVTRDQPASELPYRMWRYEVVIADAVHAMPNRDAFIREAWRVLRPGGELVITNTPGRWRGGISNGQIMRIAEGCLPVDHDATTRVFVKRS